MSSHLIPLPIQIRRNRRVIIPCVGESFDGEVLAGGGAGDTVGLEFGQDGGIVGGLAEDGDAGEVFRGRTEQRHAPNVNLLNRLSQGHTRLGNGLLEWVKVAYHQIDGRDLLGLEISLI